MRKRERNVRKRSRSKKKAIAVQLRLVKEWLSKKQISDNWGNQNDGLLGMFSAISAHHSEEGRDCNTTLRAAGCWCSAWNMVVLLFYPTPSRG